MEKLIKALEIFKKYIPNEKYPTHCEHDVLYICCKASIVTDEDTIILHDLGFLKDDEDDCFYSFHYGSC
ncbi:MAG TPA: hypothetical protein VIR31_00150 [Nitrososphaeraceae archaeon]